MTTAMDISATMASSRPPDEAPVHPDSPRIFWLDPRDAGKLADWGGVLDGARQLGFSHVLVAPPFAGRDPLAAEDFDRPHPALAAGDDAQAVLQRIAGACAERGLIPLLDVMTDYVAAGGTIASTRPDLFRSPDPARALDPRAYAPEGNIALARFDDATSALTAWWAERLRHWQDAGFAGFRLLSLRAIQPAVLRRLSATLREDGRSCLLFGWTAGLAAEQQAALAECGLDYVFCSLPWWDFRAEWLWTEAERLAAVARVIAPVAAPFGAGLAARTADPALRPVAAARAARFAAAFADGWLMPMGFEREAPQAIAAANAMPIPAAASRLLTAPGAPAIAFIRAVAGGGDACLFVANAELDRPIRPLLAPLLGDWEAAHLPDVVGPGDVVASTLHMAPPITLARPKLPRSAEAAARAPRIAIEAVTPSLDGGRFAAKRVVGETVRVGADIICDGHDQLAVALLWRSADAATWQEARMRPLGNDRWEGDMKLSRVGRWVFTIEAWRDAFATYCDELHKKHAAGIDIHLELIEGREMVAAAAGRVPALNEVMAQLARGDAAAQVAILLSAHTAALMEKADQRPFAVRLAPPCPVDADRRIAACAAWYELFPRSMSDDPHRHGTFADVIRHLPRIRDMGFDVLYFPPIHPIGYSNRKGRNNTLNPALDDPGSPYAIGNEDGGHDAIHPRLGTLEDFQALRRAVTDHGLELALDFAIQCSPDHPWLKQHREWFDWRPDGSLRYAENPPKKYQDIVNVDFYALGAVPDLWVSLCEVVLYWAEQGVRIFRVDNPHTKPLPFWEWLIAEVRADYPDAIFLAEAFTRPKMMQRLGKVGFTQSYTYFTWRHTKRELTEYLTELSTPPVADLMRPNFFVNTPDINPVFLQSSGRAGFLIRAALAATLSGLWGVYCGFELCEAAALPGREEYADSEKYQIRAWDWQRPGNIVAEIAQLNRIRRLNVALHAQTGLTFLANGHDQLLTYEKATADRSNVVLVAVSLDPRGAPAADVELPLWRWGLPDNASVVAEDLIGGGSAIWHGKWCRVALTPDAPYRIWRLRPAT